MVSYIVPTILHAVRSFSGHIFFFREAGLTGKKEEGGLGQKSMT